MTTTTSEPVVLNSDAIAALPSAPLGPPGVTHRILWQTDESMAGVLTIEAGHRLGEHAHRVNHHHLWVLAGRASVLGNELGPGGYAHIPSGVDHDIDATATEGCTVYYLYLHQAT
jgi:quercetin dioxygenase-like cupin family protein